MSCPLRQLVVLIVVLGLGCQSSGRQVADHELTAPEALTLAVELANKECEATYSTAPFEPSSYSITFEDGRWHWGALDQAGEGGFSATVSFGARGEDRKVEVFWSTDMVSEPRGGGHRD